MTTRLMAWGETDGIGVQVQLQRRRHGHSKINYKKHKTKEVHDDESPNLTVRIASAALPILNFNNESITITISDAKPDVDRLTKQ